MAEIDKGKVFVQRLHLTKLFVTFWDSVIPAISNNLILSELVDDIREGRLDIAINELLENDFLEYAPAGVTTDLWLQGGGPYGDGKFLMLNEISGLNSDTEFGGMTHLFTSFHQDFINYVGGMYVPMPKSKEDYAQSIERLKMEVGVTLPKSPVGPENYIFGGIDLHYMNLDAGDEIIQRYECMFDMPEQSAVFYFNINFDPGQQDPRRIENLEIFCYETPEQKQAYIDDRKTQLVSEVIGAKAGHGFYSAPMIIGQETLSDKQLMDTFQAINLESEGAFAGLLKQFMAAPEYDLESVMRDNKVSQLRVQYSHNATTLNFTINEVKSTYEFDANGRERKINDDDRPLTPEDYLMHTRLENNAAKALQLGVLKREIMRGQEPFSINLDRPEPALMPKYN